MDNPGDTPAPPQQASKIMQGAADFASSSAEKVSQAAQAAGRQARDAASSLAGEATENVKGLLNDQMGAGATLVGQVADSVRAAADHLHPNSPQLASVARMAATQIDGFSDRIRDRSVEELYQEASDFARRQPAAVFGLAALAGFFFFRIMKADGRSGGYGAPAERGYGGPQGGYPGSHGGYAGSQGGYGGAQGRHAGSQGGFGQTGEERHGL